jgi:gas vesicle protein
MNDEKKEKKEKKDEVKEVSKRGGRTAVAVAATLLSGLVIGFVTGILFAPKKGEKTRKEIVDKTKELYTKGKDTVTGAIDKTKEFTKESKSKFDKVVDIITPKKKNSENDSK